MCNSTGFGKEAKHLVLALTRLEDGGKFCVSIIGIAARLILNPFMIFFRNISGFELKRSLKACQAK